MPAPVLPGGVFTDATSSWAFWASLASRAVAAGGQGVTLPNTPSGSPALVTNPTLTGMSTLEGPGLAYTAMRGNTVAYAMSQQQTNTVAAKPNPFQY